MRRSYVQKTRWSGALLAGALLFSYAFGPCWYVVACADCCCQCGVGDDAGNAGAPSAEVGLCGSELASRTAADSPSSRTADGTVLAETRQELFPQHTWSGVALTLGDPPSSRSDALYLLHASFLI